MNVFILELMKQYFKVTETIIIVWKYKLFTACLNMPMI